MAYKILRSSKPKNRRAPLQHALPKPNEKFQKRHE